MLKTKIVATFGPSCSDPATLVSLYEHGVRIFRINTSFPTVDEVGANIAHLRKHVPDAAILIDLQGFKVRIQGLHKPIALFEGNSVRLGTGKKSDQKDEAVTLSLDYPKLFSFLKKGNSVLIDEGKVVLSVVKADETSALCKVVDGGMVFPRKTVNVPGVVLDFPSLSEKDLAIAKLAAKHEVEFLALSFVRSAEDIIQAKKIIGKSKIKLISKIENSQGVANFDEILTISDGIMVARGDLGVETPLEQVPLRQKEFLRKAQQQGKPSIIATHILESMIESPVPTRAEISDIANAIFDGADALMLSGETAMGKYPVKAVMAMAKTARVIERHRELVHSSSRHEVGKPMTNAIARAVYDITEHLPIAAILVATASGTTARAIASFRPKHTVFAFTSTPLAALQLNLTYGVEGVCFPHHSKGRDVAISTIIDQAKKQKFIKKNDLVLIVSGANIMHQGATNMVEIQEVV
ncbi:MAG: pyruvate kinase [bacterium]